MLDTLNQEKTEAPEEVRLLGGWGELSGGAGGGDDESSFLYV